MATYSKIPRSVKSDARANLITLVEEGDQIDMVDVLGRPAKGIKFVMTDSTDEIEYKLNSMVRLLQHNESSASTTVKVWSASPGFPLFSGTGSEEIEIVDDMVITSVEVISLDLSTGTTISIVAW